jgi:hypothetical protein
MTKKEQELKTYFDLGIIDETAYQSQIKELRAAGDGSEGSVESESPLGLESPPPIAAPPPITDKKEWHAFINGAQSGPFAKAELSEMAGFNRKTSVWKEGMADWMEAENATELAEIVSKIPPPVRQPMQSANTEDGAITDVTQIEEAAMQTGGFQEQTPVLVTQAASIVMEGFLKAKDLYDAEKYKDAKDILEPIAKDGFSDAQHLLGLCLYKIDKASNLFSNTKKMFNWFLLAAEQGHADAQYQVAHNYQWGFGTDKNIKKAVLWYQKAAELGHAKAQFELGMCYDKGKGVWRNYEKAVLWLRKASDQGEPESKQRLSVLLSEGKLIWLADKYIGS